MHRTRWGIVTIFLSFSLLLISLPQTGNAGRDVCAADAEKLCKGVEPGQGRVLGCLKEKMDELSPECKEFLLGRAEDRKSKVDTTQQACGKDIDQYCKDVPKGEGRVLNCLKENKAKLSPECQGYLAGEVQEAKGKQESVKQACSKEVEQYCKDVQAGQGRVLKCLKEHEASLSEECKTSLAR